MSLLLENISKNYNGRQVLNEINLDCQKGEIIGLVGRNGVGKSTLLKIIAGVITDYEGNVTKEGNVGYLSERNPMYPQMYVSEYLSWLNNLNFNTTLASDLLSRLIDQLGLRAVGGQKISTLSKGYRQRVGLAAALLSNPEILILDEPINGLDPIQIKEYRNLIKTYAKDKIVILSSHLMQEIEAICDRVVTLKDGAILNDQYLQNIGSDEGQNIYLVLDRSIDISLIEENKKIVSVSSLEESILHIRGKKNTDIRPILFDAVVAQQGRILEMRNLSDSNSNPFNPSL